VKCTQMGNVHAQVRIQSIVVQPTQQIKLPDCRPVDHRMASPCNKPWRRKRQRDQKQVGIPVRFSFSSFAADGLLASCDQHRFVAFLVVIAVVAVVTPATRLPATQGFLLPGPVSSRRNYRLWKHQTRKERPCHPVSARQLFRRHHRSLPPPIRVLQQATTTPETNDAEGTEETWTAGNVEEDFRNLERAIALSVADQTLRQQERLDMLDHFARQRRPLRDDVRNHVLAPLLASFLLTSLVRVLNLQSKDLLRLVGAACDVHFWTVYIAAPAVFLSIASFRNRAKSDQDSQSPPSPVRTMKSSDKHRRSLYSVPQLSVFGEEASTDPALADPVLCLLEQWCSASLGVIAAAPFMVRHLIDPRIASGLILMTKVAAFVSLHQFPLLHYRVLRPDQPRPISLPVWAVACLANSRLLPWSVVPDLVRLGLSWSWPQATLSHVLVAAAVSAITYGIPRRLSGNHPRPLLPRPRLLALVLAATWTARTSHLLRTAASRLVRAAMRSEPAGLAVASPGQLRDAARTLLVPCAVLMGAIGPCVHLAAYRRLVRVSHCDGLSLADWQDNGSRPRNSPSTQDARMMWRWRLHWRDPRRVLDVAREWRDDFFYWLFLSGSVQEKLRRELDSKRQHTRQGPAHQRGLAVLQRMARDRAAEREYGIPPADRTQWKQAAMDRLARVHKKNYERNSIEVRILVGCYCGYASRRANSPFLSLFYYL
jgi:hypothetical protein